MKYRGIIKSKCQEQELEKQLEELLYGLNLNKDFFNWAIKIIERESINEEDLLKEQRENLEKQINLIGIKLDKLNDLFIEGGIDIEIFNKKKENLNSEKIIFTDSLKNLKGKMGYNIEEIKKIINFGYKVSDSFKKGDVKLKKLIVKNIGSDHSLYLKKMTINLLPWYKNIQNSNNGLNDNIQKFGPLKNSINMGSIDTTNSNIRIWQGLLKSIITSVMKYDGYINTPEL